MIDLNTGLITLLGIAHAGNLFWFKSWKSHVDASLKDIHEKVDCVDRKIARIEGYINGRK